MDYDTAKNFWKKSSSYEKTFLSMHSWLIDDIERGATQATKETIRRFGVNGRNDPSDAFRHCYFSALLTRDIGYSNARFFMEAHELIAGNPDFQMDMHNNSKGFRIGLTGGDDQALSNTCFAAVKSGALMVTNP